MNYFNWGKIILIHNSAFKNSFWANFCEHVQFRTVTIFPRKFKSIMSTDRYYFYLTIPSDIPINMKETLMEMSSNKMLELSRAFSPESESISDQKNARILRTSERNSLTFSFICHIVFIRINFHIYAIKIIHRNGQLENDIIGCVLNKEPRF